MLRGAEIVGAPGEPGAARSLPYDAGGIDLGGLAADACIRYRIDLDPAPHLDGGTGRSQAAVVSNAAAWLWRSPTHRRGLRATARFEHLDGIDVAVPWLVAGENWVLDESAFEFYGHAAIGRFERERVEAAGTVFELVVLEGLSPATRAVLGEWIAAGARMAALASGRLPVERAQVLVVPVAAGADPVRFGHLTRGGGASVALLVAQDATRDALLADWKLPHELCHTWHPFVERRSAWLSEGLATYYQEVVRARAGVIPSSVAWRRLREGSDLGRDAEATLEVESARVFETFEFPRVYWGGAAIAFLADVEIRRRSGGKRALDDVMTELADCCARDARVWTAEALVDRMDALARAPVFAELVAAYVTGPHFADLAFTYDRLGLVRRGDDYETVADAPETWIREAIMDGGGDGVARVASQR